MQKRFVSSINPGFNVEEGHVAVSSNFRFTYAKEEEKNTQFREINFPKKKNSWKKNL